MYNISPTNIQIKPSPSPPLLFFVVDMHPPPWLAIRQRSFELSNQYEFLIFCKRVNNYILTQLVLIFTNIYRFGCVQEHDKILLLCRVIYVQICDREETWVENLSIKMVSMAFTCKSGA